jgi:hypothetical protein
MVGSKWIKPEFKIVHICGYSIPLIIKIVWTIVNVFHLKIQTCFQILQSTII